MGSLSCRIMCVFLILVASVTFLVPYCSASTTVAADVPEEKFGYVFSLQWNPTVCNGNPSCITRKFPNRLTVHGLWPKLTNPPCRNKIGRPFHVELLLPIRADLEQNWIEAERGKNEWFWWREWVEHGRCSNFKDVRPYFDQAMYLFHLKDWSSLVLTLFSEGDVDFLHLSQTLTARLGVRRVGLICKANPSGNQKLWEVRLYFEYQKGTGSRGWTLKNYLSVESNQCQYGMVHLPPV